MSTNEASANLDSKLAEIIQEMLDSGDSQQYAVADCLNTIASNGEGQETPGFIVISAEEIRSAAESFIKRVVEKHEVERTFLAFCREISGKGTTWIRPIVASSEEVAETKAIEQCAADWEFDSDDVVLLGLMPHDGEILVWNDQYLAPNIL
jgi:hypothetical protein